MRVAVTALATPTLSFARLVEEQRRALGGDATGCESAAIRLCNAFYEANIGDSAT